MTSSGSDNVTGTVREPGIEPGTFWLPDDPLYLLSLSNPGLKAVIVTSFGEETRSSRLLIDFCSSTCEVTQWCHQVMWSLWPERVCDGGKCTQTKTVSCWTPWRGWRLFDVVPRGALIQTWSQSTVANCFFFCPVCYQKICEYRPLVLRRLCVRQVEPQRRWSEQELPGPVHRSPGATEAGRGPEGSWGESLTVHWHEHTLMFDRLQTGSTQRLYLS